MTMCMNGVVLSAVAPLMEDNVSIRNDVLGRLPNPITWGDSYSVGDSCYCSSNFDHNITTEMVDTPLGVMSIKDVCDLLGDGPGKEGRPVYNDIQCGNGPANNAGDEDDCPGRIEYKRSGCRYIGPTWNFEPFLKATNATVLSIPTRAPTRAPVAIKAPVVVTSTKAPAAAPIVPVPSKAPVVTVANSTCGEIIQMDLWDGASDKLLVPNMWNGMTICQPLVLTIDAASGRCVRRIQFEMTGPDEYRHTRVEYKVPFFLYGNYGSSVFGRTLDDGVYTVTAIPNRQSSMNRTIMFNISRC
jgi:hypothetical protein